MKRFIIFLGFAFFAGLYYLSVSLNIFQFIGTFPRVQHPQLHNFLIEITKPLVLSTISIFAYFTGLFFRKNKAEMWSERLILICALVAALPFVLSLFMSNYLDTKTKYPEQSTSAIAQNAQSSSAASPQAHFENLIKRANDGDLDSILTAAYLYCPACDTSVKLDLREPASTTSNSLPTGLGKFINPEENIKQAFAWYELAANMDNLKAKNILGEMLVHGIGVVQNSGRALQFFNEGAKNGYLPAQFNLAAMYEYGYGVDKDLQQAHKWYNIIASEAKDQSDADALYARTLRDALAANMTTISIAQASEKARICLESKYQNCR